MRKRKRIQSFFKGIIIAFAITIVAEGFVLFGLPLLGINTSDTMTYISETITAAKNIFTNASVVEAASNSRHNPPAGPMEGLGTPQKSDDLDSPVNTGEEYTFDTTTYPYRNLLTSTQQAVYNQIYANAVAYNADLFTLVQELSESELSDTINAVFNDHPELFWLNTSYKYGYNSSGKVVQIQLSYGISESKLDAAKTNFDNAVNTIVQGAGSYSSDIEKELYIHDAISSLATYNTNAALNQSAYSALVSNSTVCAGYARAFQLVCQNAGLTCYYVTGTASNSDHAWNIISVDGDFYNVDLTWDDSISESYGSSVYTYFNLTDSAMADDHTRSTLSSKLPACTATAMSYTNVYGSTIEKSDINNNGGQITDGNFTIEKPKEPVTDWHDKEPVGNTPQMENTNQGFDEPMGQVVPGYMPPAPNR